MDITLITNLIGSLGFPIVMCILLYNRMNKQDEAHRVEVEKIAEALNNNTNALTRLSAKLEGKEI